MFEYLICNYIFIKENPRIDPTYEVKALGRRPDKYGGEMRGFFYHLVKKSELYFVVC